MIRSGTFGSSWLRAARLALLALPFLAACRSDKPAGTEAWVDPSPHTSSDVMANGVRLKYLDWGGTGEALVLIPGSGDNPHAFDGIAPQMTDKFRVVSYARRGDGRSQDMGPYDVDTMVEDLRQLLDKVGISKVNLAGWSLGGYELTRFAGLHPQRVGKLVYLDAAYDWYDPGGEAMWNSKPPAPQWPPSSADLQSFGTYRKWFTERSYRAGVPWSTAVEAYARDFLIEDSDGRLRFLFPDSSGMAKRDRGRAFYRHDYGAVKASALAIYAPDYLPGKVGDSAEQGAVRRWTDEWWHPWQRAQRARFEREMRNARVHVLEGANHMIFLFTHEREVIRLMRDFLLSANRPIKRGQSLSQEPPGRTGSIEMGSADSSALLT